MFDGSGAAPAARRRRDRGRAHRRRRPRPRRRRARSTAAGHAVLPGFIDSHVHFMINGQLDPMYTVRRPFSLAFFEAAENMRGDARRRHHDGARGRRRRPRRQDGPGSAGWSPGRACRSRSRCSARPAATATTGRCAAPTCRRSSSPTPAIPTRSSTVPTRCAARSASWSRAGADVIKVATSGGVLSPRDDPRHGHFRDDELAVLVEEATAAGRWVMAHAQATDGIKAAIRNGIRSIEHGIYLDDEAIAQMLERGTYLVPTLIAPRGRARGGRRRRRRCRRRRSRRRRWSWRPTRASVAQGDRRPA